MDQEMERLSGQELRRYGPTHHDVKEAWSATWRPSLTVSICRRRGWTAGRADLQVGNRRTVDMQVGGKIDHALDGKNKQIAEIRKTRIISWLMRAAATSTECGVP